jgi:predicted permease
MKRIPTWRRYLTFSRANIERDVADEFMFHEEMRVEEYVSRGMTESEARRAVAERLGDVAAARHECVEWGQIRATHARRANFVDGLRSDLRYAVRSLRRSPAWTAVATLTIALGVGATTTVFSVADTLLVRTLPYPGASRVYLAERQFTLGMNQIVPARVPFGMAKVWRERAHTIEDAALVGAGGRATLVTGSDSLQVNVAHAEPEFIGFSGARLLLGRVPGPGEPAPNAHLMLLTEQLWRNAFGRSPDVVGRTMKLDGEDWTIVGVTPASLSVPDFRAPRADVLQLASAAEAAGGTVLVRLKRGITRDAATAELSAIMKNANLRDVRPGPMPMPLRLRRPQDWLAIRQPIMILTVAVALLLLVACTNIAHLLLARGAARQRELAIRHALGAGRSRLVLQLATESVLIAVFGGVLAVVVGWTGLHVLTALRPPDRDFNALTHVVPSYNIIAIASVLAIGSGLVVGIVAGLRSAHRDVAANLRLGTASTAHHARSLRSALVIGEVALSATLLVAALLLVHSLFVLEHTDVGFDTRGLYGITVRSPRGMRVPDRAAFAAAVRDQVAQAVGMQNVVITDRVPGGPGFTALAVWETPDHPRSPEDAKTGASDYVVPPEYFAMMRMPVIAGHTFDAGSAERKEIVVSRTVANEVAPGRNAIGLRIRNAVARSRGSNMVGPGTRATAVPDEPWQTIIGVVPDITTNLTRDASEAALYRPLSLTDTGAAMIPANFSVLLRDDGPGAATRIRGVAETIRGDGPRLTIINVRDAIDASLVQPRYTMRVLVAVAVIGVLLAAVGLFGVISYTVGQRTCEIGVRMAMGATRVSIAKLVVGDGLRLALAGILIGLTGALAATRLIQSVVHGIARFDPVAFGGGAVLLLLVAATACIAPTLRATGTDPAVAVRAE